VDQDVTWKKEQNEYQRVLVPPSADKLTAIRDLVAGITGFNAERGDQIVMETLPFETTLLLEPPQLSQPAAPPPPGPLGLNLKLDRKTMWIMGGAAAGFVLLLVGVWVLLRNRKGASGNTVSMAREIAPGGEGSPQPIALPSAAESAITAKLAERDALQQKMDAQALNALALTPVITKTAEVMAKHLREKIKQEPEVTAQILRAWIREEES
jgi:flagellar biosynthesis/type III secretory pathway M-ring protein FliF/YscJ